MGSTIKVSSGTETRDGRGETHISFSEKLHVVGEDTALRRSKTISSAPHLHSRLTGYEIQLKSA